MKLLLVLFCKDRKKYALNMINSLNLLNIDKRNSLLLIYDSSVNNKELLFNSDINIKFNYQILYTPNVEKGELGNLNHNMQNAYNFSQENNFDYLFFLQDDIQIVREVDNKEFYN